MFFLCILYCKWYLVLTLFNKALTSLFYCKKHAQIHSWWPTSTSNEGRVSCSRKQLQPFIGYEGMTNWLRDRPATQCAIIKGYCAYTGILWNDVVSKRCRFYKLFIPHPCKMYFISAVSLSKKLYSHCLVLVGSRNGFERDLHKQIIACFTLELKQISINYFIHICLHRPKQKRFINELSKWWDLLQSLDDIFIARVLWPDFIVSEVSQSSGYERLDF